MKPLYTFPYLAIAVFLTAAACPGTVHAGCNLIPGTTKTFNAQMGSTNRPYAAPGETLEVQVRPCDTAPAGITADRDGSRRNGHLHLADRPPHAVVLTADASCATNIDAKLAACAAQLGGGVAICMPAAQSGLAIVDRNGVNALSFRFPDTDARCSAATTTDCRASATPIAPADDDCDPDNDDHTLSGAATIAVTAPGDALAVSARDATLRRPDRPDRLRRRLLRQRRRLRHAGSARHLSALHRAAATERLSRPTASTRSGRALPTRWPSCAWRSTPPAICSCRSTGRESWCPGPIPIPRILHSRIRSPIGPFSVPDHVFVGSFTPEGGKLPPIFEPVIDPTPMDPNVVTLFGSVDAPYTILRIGRRHGTCAGGVNDTQRCSTNDDCPGGTCPTTCVGDPTMQCATDGDCGGNAPCGQLFDVSGLAFNGGPLVLERPFTGQGICQDDGMTCGGDCSITNPCVNFALEAQTPVTLDSLVNQTDEARALVSSESVTLQDINGDNTPNSGLVVTLRDRDTETIQNIGHDAACRRVPRRVAGTRGLPGHRSALCVPGRRPRRRTSWRFSNAKKASSSAWPTTTTIGPTASCASSSSPTSRSRARSIRRARSPARSRSTGAASSSPTATSSSAARKRRWRNRRMTTSARCP